jgi:16S rRNA G527 N7-methylase RsmG
VSYPDLSAAARAGLASHGAEVLRWNSQFSLISRIDPELRLLALQQECDAAFQALHANWHLFRTDPATAALPLRYIDLGSGGGFPGLVWHAWLQDVGLPSTPVIGTLLIEPRDKRAWFLEHAARIADWQVEVQRTTWGRAGQRRRPPSAAEAPIPAHDLITLKALRLTDREVLAGWRQSRPATGTPVTICRFCSPEDSANESELGIPDSATRGSSAQPFTHRIPFSHPSGQDILLISHYPPAA